MKRLRASLEVSEDGAVSIAEAAPLPAEARRAARMARQLRTLHDALAKGKDFDLNGARRPALKNERRGPVPLTALRLAVERHLPDKAARRFFKDRIGVFWSGRAAIYAGNEREIAIDRGGHRARVRGEARPGRQAREGRRDGVREGDGRGTPQGAQPEIRTSRGKRGPRARRRSKPSLTRLLKRPSERRPPIDAIAGGRFRTHGRTNFARALQALFIIVLAVFALMPFRREIEAAWRATIRRASPDTAWIVFADDLQERIEKRLKRVEADKLRKRRARRAQNESDHPSGGVVQKRARRRAFGDDDAQKVASEADASARVVNADKVAAAELMPADEGEYAGLD